MPLRSFIIIFMHRILLYCFCVSLSSFFLVVPRWYFQRVFVKHARIFFSPTFPLVWPYLYIYICIMYVIIPVDVCIHCSSVEIPLCEHLALQLFFPAHHLHQISASVLYICLYKHVQRIMCPLTILCMRATFVKLTTAGTLCSLKGSFLCPLPLHLLSLRCLLYLVEARL